MTQPQLSVLAKFYTGSAIRNKKWDLYNVKIINHWFEHWEEIEITAREKPTWCEHFRCCVVRHYDKTNH